MDREERKDRKVDETKTRVGGWGEGSKGEEEREREGRDGNVRG